jgi:hypothetical protein
VGGAELPATQAPPWQTWLVLEQSWTKVHESETQAPETQSPASRSSKLPSHRKLGEEPAQACARSSLSPQESYQYRSLLAHFFAEWEAQRLTVAQTPLLPQIWPEEQLPQFPPQPSAPQERAEQFGTQLETPH